VTPPTASARPETLSVVNAGPFATCLEIFYPVDAVISANGVTVDYTRGGCADAPASFAGAWVGTFQCTSICTGSFGGDITLEVAQDGQRARYTDDGGDYFSGTVCGREFRFTRNDPGETETGTLTLNANGTASKRSRYRATSPPFCSGDCADELRRP
jgi:hypothetical protein